MLDAQAIARYRRQMILPELGQAGQEKLLRARVLVIGMGGLGSPAALYLAAAGVGTLGLADFDTVDASNLHRQILHDADREGAAKLTSAVDRLKAVNPATTLVEHPEGITVDNAVTLFAQYDVIVDGSDNFPTRYLNNDAAVLAKKPLVYGSVLQFHGQVSVFAPHLGGPCYRCLFPEMPPPGAVPNCAEAGVLGALCGIIGSWQALEAIKLITGAGQPLLGQLMTIDALTNRVRTLALAPDPACPACGENPTITTLNADRYDWSCATEADPTSSSFTPHPSSLENMSDELPIDITVQEAHARLTNTNPPLLLDVREDFERDICQIDGHVAMPMQTVPEQLAALPQDRAILVHCHHGGRSRKVTEFLRAKGYADVQNVAGGIDAWSQAIDPSVPRY